MIQLLKIYQEWAAENIVGKKKNQIIKKMNSEGKTCNEIGQILNCSKKIMRKAPWKKKSLVREIKKTKNTRLSQLQC